MAADQSDQKPGFHNESDHALTARMIDRAPPVAAGFAGIIRVLLKDSVTTILALSGVLVSLNALNQQDLERRHAEAIDAAKAQTEITRTLAGEVIGLRGELESGLSSLQSAITTLEGRVSDHDRAIQAIFEGHPRERARFEQRAPP